MVFTSRAGRRQVGVALDRLAALAVAIGPPLASLDRLGSFARGDADAQSDIDVLAVRAQGLSSDDEAWTDFLGSWADRTTHPVKPIGTDGFDDLSDLP